MSSDVDCGMFIHRSHRTEALADALAELFAVPLADPFDKDVVVVAGRGMERWLAMQLAERQGVFANVEQPFPRAFVETILAETLGARAKEVAAQGPSGLAWAILSTLPDFADDPRFEAIVRYVGGRSALVDGPLGARFVSLAHRIADVFDRYATFRPVMVREWLRGEDGELANDFQPALFRALRARVGAPTLTELVFEALERLATGPRPEGLPSRVAIFGVSSLPPLYVTLFRALSRHVAVHVFVLTPSRQYFADVKSPRERARETKAGIDEALQHFDEGHPLLAALGRLGREFQFILEDENPAWTHEDDRFDDAPERRDVLHTLQADMLDLEPRGTEGRPLGVIADDDRSITLHACHGPMRQVEVVRDVLLDLFDTLPGLEPRDVIVMCADVETYAPLFEAVFSDGDAYDSPPEAKRAGFPRLPFRIADRSMRRENALGEAFLAVAKLVGGRFSAPEVIDVLGLEPMRARFALSTDDLARIREIVADLGIRWGLDAETRKRFDQPAVSTATFRAGLERLALGVALGDADVVVAHAAPYDAGDRALVGRFIDAVETLHEAVTKLERSHPPAALTMLLDEVITALFAPKDPWEAHQVRSLLAPVVKAAAEAKIERPLTPDAFTALVETALGASGGGGAFLGGGITVCAMVPMRSIPFRVIVLVGLDDGAFPRTAERVGFDLTAKAKRPGDRNVQDDDRYLLLEALISARDRLVITYTGRDLRDAERLPPAVPVAELLDAIGRGFLAKGATPDMSLDARRDAVKSALLREHPLHASDPKLFDARAPFSFDARRLVCAEHMLAEKSPPEPFITGVLVPVVDERIELDRLARFFADPVKGFFTQRLEVYLDDDADSLDDRERLELDALESWEIGQAHLRAALSDRTQSFDELEARSKLPMGKSGRAALEQVEARLATIVSKTRALTASGAIEPLAIELPFGQTRIAGRLLDRYETGRVVASFARPKKRTLVDAWIRHVVAHATQGVKPFETHLVGRGSKDGASHQKLVPIAKRAKALELLSDLARLYDEGRRTPLPLFPETSYAYASIVCKVPKSEPLMRRMRDDEARDMARRAFEKNFMTEGEGGTPYVTRLVGPEPRLEVVDFAPFTRRFSDVAIELFEPMLAHYVEDAS